MIIIICLFYFLFFIYDLLPLYKEKNKKTIWVYVILFFSAFVINILFNFGIDIPSPAKPLEQIISSIAGLD